MRTLINRAFYVNVMAIFFIAATSAHGQSLAPGQVDIYTDLYDFAAPSMANLQYPDQLAQGFDGNLYGTQPFAGVAQLGEIFRATPDGKITVLFSFDGSNGSYPQSGLTLGTDGNFYGTTFGGGTFNSGTVFKVSPSGTLTTLYNFTGNPDVDGANPISFPVQSVDGNFYGTTDTGTAYRISSKGTFYVLTTNLPGHSIGPLIQGRDGSFYGVTSDGGQSDSGSVFKLTSAGSITVLHSFVQGVDGAQPYGPLALGPGGDFYGTTTTGGQFLGGTLFKVSPQGQAELLYYFSEANTGFDAIAGPVLGSDGNLYGATVAGGTGSVGVLFRWSISGIYSVLYNMDSLHGANPAATPVQSTNGKFYGLTNPGGLFNSGVLYSLDVGLSPFVSAVTKGGKVGKSVVFLGQGLTGTSGVSFHGTASSFTVLSDTALSVVVPQGAASGFVTVTTSNATLRSNLPFVIIP